ncbi:MAG: RagB/SusD family nutrient uptake outer membrane protein [Chitinophagaceae bacterium]
MKVLKHSVVYLLLIVIITSCKKEFLNTLPLSATSDATFWTSFTNANTWINFAYRSLPSASDYIFDSMSDDCVGAGDLVAQGLHVPISSIINSKWDYAPIRQSFELLAHLDQIPNLTDAQKNGLAGQAHFIISFRYFEMITLYGDIPFFDKVVPLTEADLPKTDKTTILTYILKQLDMAATELPASWPATDNGRATKGAALALKARVNLYNGKWADAASSAQAVMDLGSYSLHPNYDQVFQTAYNNKTKEVILAYQYAKDLFTHTLCFAYGFYTIGGTSSSLPTPDLVNSYQCSDGLSITQSPLYDPKHPFDNRDPRFHMNFILPFENFNGQVYDPVNNINDRNAAKTYIYFRKYISDMLPQQRTMWVNWNIFRYAEVLLTYAEAKNEASGPDNSVYNAIDQIRKRAGMPVIDRIMYNSQDKLREAIRNERRVEMAGEGLRYFDILRWKTAEKVLNKVVYSFEIPGVLPIKNIETRVFDASKNYLWPIPQYAIDNAKQLKQNPAWK